MADFYAFMGRYFRQNQFNRFMYEPHSWTESKIKNIIEQVSVSFKRQDCLDLPPMTYQVYTFEMSKEQEDDYIKLEKDMVISLDCVKCDKFNSTQVEGQPSPCMICDKSLLLENILNLGAKLDQIVNGYMYGGVETKNIIAYKSNPKIDTLFEVMDGIYFEDKIVIWCPYIPLLKSIEERLKKEKISYARGYESDDVFAAAEIFNNNPGIRVFLVSQRKGGTGLNLTSANYEIFVANDFSLVLRDQAEARLHRPGQLKNVCVIDIVCTGTADEAIYDALRYKKNMALRLLENLRVISAKRKDITEECEIGS
jgi:SNF2 family DNA or RNA helicase